MNGNVRTPEETTTSNDLPDAPENAPAETAPPVEPDPRQVEIVKLQGELDAARRRVDELARAYQAGERDREDFKQRLQREREQLIDVERGKVALMVIEAIDELDLCLQAAGSDGSSLAQGVRLIRDNLVNKVQGTGIERLEVVGQSYDPNVAEAADMEITGDPNMDQRVTAEMRAGYRLKNRVIRPARVKVAKYVKPADA